MDADDAGILARLKAEGTASPADVILLVDAARLWKGDADGLFKPIKSPCLKPPFRSICAPGKAPKARPGLAFLPAPASWSMTS